MNAETRLRIGHSSTVAKATVVLMIAALVVAVLRRRPRASAGSGLRQGSRTGRAHAGAEHRGPRATTAAEDLVSDRRFERSLVPREATVVLAIAILIVVRQLLS